MSCPSINRDAEKGATLIELLIGLGVCLLVGSSVFAGLSRVMLFSSQDEITQNLRDDLYISMNYIRRDCRLATNVVAQAGTRLTSGTTLVLRQPKVDLNNEIVDEEFQFVTYTVEGEGSNGGGGLVRELWNEQDDPEPIERKILNENVVTLGFLYGGKAIGNLENLTVVRDIELIMISARETGLVLQSATGGDIGDYINVEDLQYMAESGIDFSYLRAYIDYMNSSKVDITVASSIGAATVRNKRSLGLNTVEIPGGV
ncbi:MAG: hypothetical protein KC931_01970 [Candidatus Omnitrophica bacterium]|nr:hypothetical protein [Candidatus Omnitrophota bacterium]MCA9429674.1 hypothetical protein [Candidatus Omnitrophota bacterium]MCA9435194.1 hypothetical protein [Candidatus Omnitrophota bacterium]MCA9445853.1 hypothetical protein [Candidatus Omnitrophota bacterium]MCB9782793.1 hypothetical protein [Candidatus Omnitrophota bacterium]